MNATSPISVEILDVCRLLTQQWGHRQEPRMRSGPLTGFKEDGCSSAIAVFTSDYPFETGFAAYAAAQRSFEWKCLLNGFSRS